LRHAYPTPAGRHVFPGQGEVTTLYYVKIDATRVNAVTWLPL
jgi:hypothetical protein